MSPSHQRLRAIRSETLEQARRVEQLLEEKEAAEAAAAAAAEVPSGDGARVVRLPTPRPFRR